MIRYDLAGKTALVTGGATGIGLATSTMLGRNGARVAVNFLPGDARGAAAVAELKAAGIDAVPAPGDVATEDGARKLIADAVGALGRLDLLVNNAGTPGTKSRIEPADLDKIDDALWKAVMDVNLIGIFRCTRAAAPALRAAKGAVVNTASIAGFGSIGSSLAYGASKAGVINLTKNLARALAPDVRVNAVAPGAVNSTWMVEWTDEQRRASIEQALLKRRCTTDDIAEVIVFLGFGAAMVTGQTVVVDGGLTV